MKHGRDLRLRTRDAGPRGGSRPLGRSEIVLLDCPPTLGPLTCERAWRRRPRPRRHRADALRPARRRPGARRRRGACARARTCACGPPASWSTGTARARPSTRTASASCPPAYPGLRLRPARPDRTAVQQAAGAYGPCRRCAPPAPVTPRPPSTPTSTGCCAMARRAPATGGRPGRAAPAPDGVRTRRATDDPARAGRTAPGSGGAATAYAAGARAAHVLRGEPCRRDRADPDDRPTESPPSTAREGRRSCVERQGARCRGRCARRCGYAPRRAGYTAEDAAYHLVRSWLQQ